MAQQDEPLYDFPEPAQPSRHKLLCPQRGRGSLRSISVLDRLLLTVPVWLQLSVNPATALHILQREPPGTFLVRRSRTSQKNVLCVRLADDSVPSFVQQFGIREEQSTLSLETSAIIFPDLPRLISFYCVSRDVLPFPLELPEAIAKATSHKELESISHMGIEFWSSHLNVRGPREAPKPRKDEEKQPDAVTSASPATQPDSAPHPDPDDQPATAASDSDNNDTKSDSNPTLFHKFCPITTRSPRELDCGSGQGALCFINPLFLQSQSTLSRRRMFKHSLKVRVSMESSTMLSPPLAPPPPPPLMPKAKGRCKVQKVKQRAEQPSETPPQAVQANQAADGSQDNPSGTHFFSETPEEDQIETEPGECKVEEDASAQLPAVLEPLCDDYMKPCPAINCISLSPYQSPSVAPMAPSLFPKVYPSCSPHNSPSLSPSLSPYHSPSPSPKALLSLSPNVSPSISPSISPYTSPSSSPLTEQVGGTHPNASGGEESEEVHTEENHHNGEEKIDFFKKEECFSAESPQESETYSSNRPAEKTETETLSPNEQTSQTSSQQT